MDRARRQHATVLIGDDCHVVHGLGKDHWRELGLSQALETRLTHPEISLPILDESVAWQRIQHLCSLRPGGIEVHAGDALILVNPGGVPAVDHETICPARVERFGSSWPGASGIGEANQPSLE